MKNELQKDNTDTSIQTANLESTPGNAPLGKKKDKGLFARCSIRVHSKRSRLADPDGISAKAVIDGISKAGLLRDDSTKYVKEVLFSQEITKENEETVIELIFD